LTTANLAALVALIRARIKGKAGSRCRLPCHNDQGARGWLRSQRSRGGNNPHNWTGAEMVAALRSAFVVEAVRS
jgi:hypothetical protein